MLRWTMTHARGPRLLRSHLAIVLFTWLFSASGAHAQDWGPFSALPQVSRLDNGLTVVTVPWPTPGIVAYYTLVRVGSRDEVEKGHSGFAHLFEHMMFRGTERFPQKVYEERIQDLGADNNAYTTQDFTLYTVTAPASALAQVAELESDRFQRLKFDEEVFRTETGAVLGEYNKSAASPFLTMWQTLSEISFSQHTYGHTTIGYLADVKAMPEKYEYAKSFFRRFYTPDDCTLIVAGEVKHDQVLALAKQYYGSWQGKRDQPLIPVEPEPKDGATRHIDWEGTSPPKMMIAYRGPAFEREASEGNGSAALIDTAALEVLHGLLFDASAPLYQRLVVDEQRLLALSSWSSNFSRDPGLFVMSAELKPDTSFAEVQNAVQDAIDEIAQGKGDLARMEDVRSHIRYALTMNVETASEAADTLAQFVSVTGAIEGLPRYLDALAQVKPADVARAAQTYLRPTRRFSVTLSTKAKQGGAP
jgi:zinc protease